MGLGIQLDLEVLVVQVDQEVQGIQYYLDHHCHHEVLEVLDCQQVQWVLKDLEILVGLEVHHHL